MVNRNSKDSEYTPLRSDNVISKAKMAIKMKEQGIPVESIAHTLKLSKSRIYEYLRKDFL